MRPSTKISRRLPTHVKFLMVCACILVGQQTSAQTTMQHWSKPFDDRVQRCGILIHQNGLTTIDVILSVSSELIGTISLDIWQSTMAGTVHSKQVAELSKGMFGKLRTTSAGAAQIVVSVLARDENDKTLCQLHQTISPQPTTSEI